MKRHSFIAALVAAAALVACGGAGEPAPASSAARIQYAQNTQVGKGRVADYLNAEWLYENYFGQMGLPPEIKPKLMVEMRRLSNGFAMQLALGDDVESNLGHFHSTMSSGVGQAKLASFAQRMSDTDAAVQLNAGTVPDAQALAEAPILDDVDLAHVAAATETDRVALANLQAVAASFGLPYDLTRDPTPYISWSASFIAQKSKGGVRQGGGGASGSTNEHGSNSWPWIHGDILRLNWNSVADPNKDKFPLGHMAIIDKEDAFSPAQAIDAHPDNRYKAVMKYERVEDLASKYRLAQGHHMKLPYEKRTYCISLFPPYCATDWTRRSYVRIYAVDIANSMVGISTYDILAPKDKQDQSYCSQLIWNAYKIGSYKVRYYQANHPDGFWNGYFHYDDIDVDLDSDGGFWVTPNDIINSEWVQPAFRVNDNRAAPNQIRPGDFDGAASYVQSAAFRLPMKLSMLQ